jgi:hypothetical protein
MSNKPFSEYSLGSAPNKPYNLSTPASSSQQKLIRKTLARPKYYSSQTRRKAGAAVDFDYDVKTSSDSEPEASSSTRGTAPSRPHSSIQSDAFEMPPLYDFGASKEVWHNTLFESPEDIKLDSKSALLDTFTQPPAFDYQTLRAVSSPAQPKKCPFCAKLLPKGFKETPPTAARAKFGFCKRHEDFDILQRGSEKGYPKTALKEQIVAKRVRRMLPELRKFERAGEFVGAIRSRTKRGATAAATYSFAHLTVPGYYGPRGTQVVTRIVMKEMEGDIKQRAVAKDVDFFGGVMGYVSAVVVPEVGVRLICEDMDLKWSEGKKVMESSVEYGGVLNPLEDENVSTDEDED